jgi:hypothetical protein
MQRMPPCILARKEAPPRVCYVCVCVFVLLWRRVAACFSSCEWLVCGAIRRGKKGKERKEEAWCPCYLGLVLLLLLGLRDHWGVALPERMWRRWRWWERTRWGGGTRVWVWVWVLWVGAVGAGE